MVNVEKEVNRLKYTIGNGNRSSSKDEDALNNLTKYVNTEKERTLNNHNLFAKLFINVFKNDIIKSKGNYQMSLDVVKMILNIDLETHYEGFKNEINQIWLEKEIKDNDLDDFDYPKWDIKQTRDRLNSVITNLIEDYG